MHGKEGGKYDWPPKDQAGAAKPGAVGGYRSAPGVNRRSSGQYDVNGPGSGRDWDNRGSYRGGYNNRRGGGTGGGFVKMGSGRDGGHWRAEGADHSPGMGAGGAGDAAAAGEGTAGSGRWRMDSEEREGGRHGSGHLSAGSPVLRSQIRTPGGTEPSKLGAPAGAATAVPEAGAAAEHPLPGLSEAMKRRLGFHQTGSDAQGSDGSEQPAKKPRLDGEAATLAAAE